MSKGSRYAQGKHAKGQCQRCGLVFRHAELIRDGYTKNLMVCRSCFDPEHPQEQIKDLSDAVALRDPAPLNDSPTESTTLLVDVLDGGTTFGGET